MSHMGPTKYNFSTPKFFIKRAVYPRLTGYSAPTTVTLRMSLSALKSRTPASAPTASHSLRSREDTDHREDRIRSQRVHPALERQAHVRLGSRRRRRQP